MDISHHRAQVGRGTRCWMGEAVDMVRGSSVTSGAQREKGPRQGDGGSGLMQHAHEGVAEGSDPLQTSQSAGCVRIGHGCHEGNRGSARLRGREVACGFPVALA